MTSIEDAWTWCQNAKQGCLTLNALGRYWATLPWDQLPTPPGRLAHLEADELFTLGSVIQSPLDDLGVLVLFSAFESEVRDSVLSAVTPELQSLSHPVAQEAVKKLTEEIEEGSFFRLLNALKVTGDKGLIEEVNQVRKYRNWVAHGRRGDEPDRVDPKTAYERLTRFLQMIGLRPTELLKSG